MLERSRCPEAIPALARVMEKYNRWSKVLRVIIALADQPEMVKGQEKYPNGDCPEAGEGPYWASATPILTKTVSDFDGRNELMIQDATIAVEALANGKANGSHGGAGCLAKTGSLSIGSANLKVHAGERDI
jgi:hypothetical protein